MRLRNNFIFVTLFVLLFTNTVKPQTDTSVMHCVKMTGFFPLVGYDKQVVGYDTAYAYIYSYGNQLMYYMSRSHFELGRTKEETPIKKQFYHRLVFTKGQTYGNYYNDRLLIYNKKVPVDSILNDEWSATKKIDMDTIKSFDTLVTLKTIPYTDTLLEVHRWKGRLDTNVCGITSLYYMPFKAGLPQSMDTVLEKMRGMTLCKVVWFVHVGYMEKGVFRIFEFNRQNEMQEIPVTNRDELLVFFRHNQKGEYFPQVADVGW